MAGLIRPALSAKAIQRRNDMQVLLINELNKTNSISEQLICQIVGALCIVGRLSEVRWSTCSNVFLVESGLLNAIHALLMPNGCKFLNYRVNGFFYRLNSGVAFALQLDGPEVGYSGPPGSTLGCRAIAPTRQRLPAAGMGQSRWYLSLARGGCFDLFLIVAIFGRRRRATSQGREGVSRRNFAGHAGHLGKQVQSGGPQQAE